MNKEQPLDYAVDPDPSRVHKRPLVTRYEKVARWARNCLFVLGFMLVCFGLTWQAMGIIGD